MLMLTLDDAIAICMGLLHATTYFDDMSAEEYENIQEFVKGEFEQKCWFPPKKDEAARHLNDLIFHIDPEEICIQIKYDNLRNWCRTVQNGSDRNGDGNGTVAVLVRKENRWI